jgi:flagellar biosynthesis chaperone FliJ
MKKYQFRLDAVLRVRRIEEERARADLLGANRALAEAEAELDRRLEHYRTVTLPGGALAHDDYLAARSRQDHAAASVVAAGTARLAAEAERQRLHDIWAGTAARVKALERLDDRRREEHAAEVLREEVIVLDEVATATRLIGADR